MKLIFWLKIQNIQIAENKNLNLNKILKGLNDQYLKVHSNELFNRIETIFIRISITTNLNTERNDCLNTRSLDLDLSLYERERGFFFNLDINDILYTIQGNYTILYKQNVCI